MSLKLLYSLIFFKLYRFTSFTRSKEGAILASSLIIGFLQVVWVFNILAAFKIYDIIPNGVIMPLFGITIGINMLYILKGKKYEKMIAEIEGRSIPLFFHIIAYLLFLWTFIGVIFL